jgi:hypothetical protein
VTRDVDNDWDQSAVFPVPVLHELYVDLDLRLLTATDDTERWSAIVAGTAEVLDRFDHITSSNVICPTDTNVIGGLRAARRSFQFYDQPLLAGVLSEPIAVLSAHELVHKRCITGIRAALQQHHQSAAITAISNAATMLNETAKVMRDYRFQPFPAYPTAQPVESILSIAASGLRAEAERNPLSKQLDGAGGMAGSPEHNPYVAALYELQLASHRRIYRRLYRFCEHVGIDFSPYPSWIWKRPDQVDEEQFDTG